MDDSLIRQLESRLAEAAVDDRTRTLVLAACHGKNTLTHALDSDEVLDSRDTQPLVDAPEVFLASIAVEGFRGIGRRAVLDLVPGPGLTLVVGRNGSGKSSFAEGLEMLLTGSNLRWADKAAAWRDGWRNIHHGDPTGISAEFLLSGSADPCEVRRTWQRDAELDDSADEVAWGSRPVAPLASLGWTAALDNFRPFLSYNELGSMLTERPSDLHDALSAFLGLETLMDAQELLRKERLVHEQAAKDLKSRTSDLVAILQDSDDTRAAEAVEILDARQPDTAALARIGTTHADGDSSGLAAIASLQLPDVQELSAAADELSAALTAVSQAAASEAGGLARTAALLRSAHEHLAGLATDECPVCGTPGVIDDDWRSRTMAQVEQLEVQAAAVTDASVRLEKARRTARTCITSVPSALRGDVELPSVGAVVEAWTAWAEAPESDIELIERLRGFGPVAALSQQLRSEAVDAMHAEDSAWAPLARAIAGWVEHAEQAARESAVAKEIKAAESWLKEAVGDIRTERFSPIADQAREFWDVLRHRSNVQLEEVTLAGANTQRRVSLEVTVDGTPASALGVMSQGELHALALSLFLPRATMAQSPFRFVVIDDPVQAMDPARVDGLARVLEQVAATHQLVVFTHDDRLPESVHRLGITAEVIEVTRQEGSQVSTRVAWDAVTTAIDDARAIAYTKDMVLQARQKVVPNYCRLALEAAAAGVVRRRRLGAGANHFDVERELDGTKSLREILALAIFDDASRRSDINDHLRTRCSPGAPSTVHWCNSGAHGDYNDDPKLLVKDTELVAKYLRSLA